MCCRLPRDLESVPQMTSRDRNMPVAAKYHHDKTQPNAQPGCMYFVRRSASAALLSNMARPNQAAGMSANRHLLLRTALRDRGPGVGQTAPRELQDPRVAIHCLVCCTAVIQIPSLSIRASSLPSDCARRVSKRTLKDMSRIRSTRR